MEKIKNVIQSYIEISDTEWADYSSGFSIRTYKKKEIILEQGRVCRHIFFVKSGLLRVFFVDKTGEEKTFHFSLESTFSADYRSFLRKVPSNYSIQAMENCELVLMSYDMLHAGYQKLRNGEKLGRLLAEEHFFLFSDRIRAIYTQSPLERYQQLIQNFPELLQRVPQHYIASYLNISSVHLSRLKSNRH